MAAGRLGLRRRRGRLAPLMMTLVGMACTITVSRSYMKNDRVGLATNLRREASHDNIGYEYSERMHDLRALEGGSSRLRGGSEKRGSFCPTGSEEGQDGVQDNSTPLKQATSRPSQARSWVTEVFMPKYFELLGKRGMTFLTLFQRLEERGITKPVILETGTTRKPLTHHQFWADGGSTLLFDSYVNFYASPSDDSSGRVVSVDISVGNCHNCRGLVSNKTEVICGDSVNVLHEFQGPVDVLYLDSFDLDWGQPHASSLHHIKELCAVLKNLRDGSIVIVDDNERGVGKGRYIDDFMNNIGAETLFDAYQIGFIYRKSTTRTRFTAQIGPNPTATPQQPVKTVQITTQHPVDPKKYKLLSAKVYMRGPAGEWEEAPRGEYEVSTTSSGGKELSISVRKSKPRGRKEERWQGWLGWLEDLEVHGELEANAAGRSKTLRTC